MIPDRYSRENLKRVTSNPGLITKEIRRLTGKAIQPLQNRYYEISHQDPVDVMAEEWDTLVILDACRYDVFTEVNTLGGDLAAVQSPASWSGEFLQKSFEGRKLYDTVYVTANPYAEDLSNDVFHDIKSVLDMWDEDLGTVLPEDVTQAAIDAYSEYPEKRLIVHYMQPHQPWIGPMADDIRERASIKGWMHNRVDEDSRNRTGEFQLVRDGVISHEEMYQAYRESLEIALSHVERLLDAVPGKTIITADHAELLGERITPVTPPLYGHPQDLKFSTLRRVPWLKITTGERRHITTDPPTESTMTVKDREQRLAALGYRS